MKIIIRKENWGYILFDRFQRVYQFISTEEKLEEMHETRLITFLQQHFRIPEGEQLQWIFLDTPFSALPLSAPVGMYLEICHTCNLSCSHCYKALSPLEEPLSTSEIMGLIDDLKEMGVFEIRLCGNEPTAHPDFFEICKYILGKDMYLGVNTNAWFTEEFQEKFIDVKPNLVVVSLDGTPEIHDRIRRKGSYERAYSFLTRLKEAGIKHRINSLVSSITLPCLDHIVDIAHETSSGISFLPFRTVGRPTWLKDSGYLTREMMHEAVVKITALRKKYPEITLLTYFDILDEKATYHHSMDFNSPCPARKNGFITYSGKYYPCDFLQYLGDRFLCGDIKYENFSTIWTESKKLTVFQNIQHERCHSCTYYMKKCYGGCISHSILSTDSPDDELCFVDLIK